MESIIIAAPFPCDDALRARLARGGFAAVDTGGVLVIDGPSSRVYLARDDRIREELEPEALEQLASTMTSPVFYALDFSDIDLCRRVVACIADDPALVVDTDHGLILPGPAFVQRLRTSPGWDWRRDPR